MSSPFYNVAATFGKWNAYITVFLLIVSFVVAIGVGFRTRSQTKDRIPVAGKITREPKCTVIDKRTACKADVSYEYDGKTYTARMPVDAFAIAGDPFSVLVNPHAPGSAMPDVPNAFLSPWFLGCGVLVICLAAVVANYAAKSKKFAVLAGLFSVVDGGILKN